MQQVKFIHTSDWQLGATRSFLSAEAQARWTASRFDAIRRIGQVALEEQCEFIVVAGDVFESNHVDRRTVLRACEALSEVSVPVFLLPGNHDPLDAGAVFNSSSWKSNTPENVHVLVDPTQPYELRPGIEVLGAPWFTKRPLTDLVARGLEGVPMPTGIRVMVAHGATDTLSPDRDDPALIVVGHAEAALAEGQIHYLALGDRHSLTQIGSTGRIWYSGTPEVYAFDEIDPSHALIVEIRDGTTNTRPVQIGTWQFRRERADLANVEDVEAFDAFIDTIDNKEQSVLRLELVGTLALRDHARLMEIIDRADDLFAGVHQSDSGSNLIALPDDDDFSDLSLSGFAATAIEKLRAAAAGGGPDAEPARDALALFVRIASTGR